MCQRLRSGLSCWVSLSESRDVRVHGNFGESASGQLKFLGSNVASPFADNAGHFRNMAHAAHDRGQVIAVGDLDGEAEQRE